MRLFLLLTFCLTALTAYSQKFGYLNSTAILQTLPEIKQADAQIKELRESLGAEMDQKMTKFQTSYQAYLNEVDEGLLSKSQMQERESLLSKSRADIGKFEQESTQTIAQKREALLRPILEKVDNAIQMIGDEHDYTFIFDTSASGTLLYAPEGDDITHLVLARLGVK